MQINKLWVFLALILIALMTASLWLNFRFNATSCNGPDMQVWSHRGDHTELPENSRAAVERAFESGFTGVEIDVFYDPALGLVVSHDRPYKKVNDSIVLLQDVIYGYGPDFHFWLDLKNLKDHVKDVRRELNTILEREEGLRERILIESSRGGALRRLNDDFYCIYWVQFQRTGLRGWLKRTHIKFILALADFSGITTDHRYIDEAFRKHFRNKCWYVFTVNDPERLEALRRIPEVEVVLTDLPKREVNALSRELDI